MKKPPVMSAFSGKLPMRRSIWMVLVVTLVLSVVAYPAPAKKPIPLSGVYRGTVVIDPGHGGHDTGAKGAEDYYEKTAALTLSRLISDKLEPDYRVVLTRNGDYRLDLPSRTAVANQEKADIFISVHTSGSHNQQENGLSIFYFKEPSESMETDEPNSNKPVDSGEPQIWDIVQIRHQTESIGLAKHLHSFFQNDGTVTVNPIEGLPLLVLRGADMPAVLIEIGNLIHPLEGKSLRDPNYLSELADQISNVIESYIKKK